MSVCPKCRHLIDELPHKCPSPEYLKARDTLISQAAAANISEEEEQCLVRQQRGRS